ncbi:MAG: restriction endonuclease subunit S [Gammaproteobacteria bacterium]
MKSLDSIFHVDKGHQLALNRVDQVSDIPNAIAYVARSHRNNGITAWVRPIDGIPPANAGDISVCLRSRNHSMAAFVQPRPFYTTYHVAILTPKKPMSLQEKLWWCLCIRANRFRFHFGRQANRTIGSLLLPDHAPDWALAMELPRHANNRAYNVGNAIDPSSWDSFRLLDLFLMHVGQHTTRRDLGLGRTPLVTASAWNNGISAKVEVPPDWSGGQITVANNGSVGAAFYQPRPFTASRDVTILDPQIPLSTAAALFVCTMLRKESARFNYARKWTTGRMRECTIRLPAKAGKPDVGAMEALIKSLPLGWALP